MAKPKKTPPLNVIASTVAGLGVPGLILAIAISAAIATGLTGGAAITTALAAIGMGTGMVGGIAILVAAGLVAAGIAAYLVEFVDHGPDTPVTFAPLPKKWVRGTSDELQFRFSIEELPKGEAVILSEIEQSLLKTLDARGGKCLDSLASLGCLYQRLGYFDQASGCIQRSMELTDNPEELGAGHLALGQVEESRGDYTAAAQRYRAALSMEPCSTRTWYLIHNNLGYALNQTKDHASAIPYLETAITIDAGRSNAYKNLGLAYEGLGDLEKAAELYITATQVNAADSRSLQHLISLVDANPVLEVDIPNLRKRIKACENAVEVARQHQPDFDKHWARLRAEQKRKWWQFWKSRPDRSGSAANPSES